MKVMLTTLAICTALSVPRAQDAGERAGPPVLKLDDLKLVHYTPRFAYSEDLEEFLRGTVERHIYIAEREGMQSSPIRSVSLLGDSLILYDTAEHVSRILEILKEVDVDADEPEEELVTRRDVLRHLPSPDAEMALQPLAYVLPNGNSNVTLLRDRRMVVMRGTAGEVREMEALLADLDVPEDQFRIHVQLIRGQAGSGAAEGIDEELRRELAQLLPAFRFEPIGFALLQSAANPGRIVSLDIEGHGARYHLVFKPVAYDGTGGHLTVQDCALEKSADQGSGRIFSTNTVFRGGEYTVLGAAGAEPVFVVVRVTPVR